MNKKIILSLVLGIGSSCALQATQGYDAEAYANTVMKKSFNEAWSFEKQLDRRDASKKFWAQQMALGKQPLAEPKKAAVVLCQNAESCTQTTHTSTQKLESQS